MALFPAIISRRFSWKLMILGASVGAIIGPIFMGWRAYPWPSLPFVFAAIIVIHPVMNQDLPNLIGADMLKSPRTYITIILIAIAQLLAIPYQREFFARFLTAR